MSDVPTTTPEQSPDTAKQDNTLRSRQLLVAVLSVILGGASVAVMMILTNIPLAATFPISAWEVSVLLITTLPMALFFMIWLDRFMGTGLVRD